MATCSSADSVLEAASQIKSNATKLDTFVNGTASQTVQLGTGDPTPTLRKFVADAQDIVTQAAMDAGQTILDDVAQNSLDIADLKSSKADKAVPADAGTLAGLDETGNLRDSGCAVYDLVHLLAYAEGCAVQATQNVRDALDAWCETTARHRLQTRLFDGTTPASSSKPVLFVISGQSNAVGFGDYAPFDAAPDCGQYWSWADGADALKPLVDPIGNRTGKGSAWCAFARSFFGLTGRKVILLSIGNGGAAVTDGGYTTTNTWADNEYGTLRSSRQTVWNAFSAAVPASAYDLGGIIWSQGEAEAVRIREETVTVADYKTGTLDALAWTRELAGDADAPVFMAKIGNYAESYWDYAALNRCTKIVQDAQEELAQEEDVFLAFQMTPYFYLAESEYMSDMIHYSRRGYSVLGRSLAHYIVNNLNL